MKKFGTTTLIFTILIGAISLVFAGDSDTSEIVGRLLGKDTQKPLQIELEIWGCANYNPKDKTFESTAISIQNKFPYRVKSDKEGYFKFSDLPDIRDYSIKFQYKKSLWVSLPAREEDNYNPCISVKKGKATDIGTFIIPDNYLK